MTQRVILLGAGFSKAVAGVPTVVEVAREIDAVMLSDSRLKALASLCPARQPGERFEVWLSRLAEPDLWLDEAEKRACHGLVDLLTEWFVEAIFSAQHNVDPFDDDEVKARFPLADAFVERLGAGFASSVITLNYDTVVEREFARWSVRQGDSDFFDEPRLNPYQITHRCRDGGRADLPMFKLHGSTHWFTNRTGEDIFDVGFAAGGCEASVDETWWQHQEVHAPGYRRLIVPPVTVKREFYSLPVLVRQWKMAVLELRSATEVIVVGYSLPEEDSMLLRLLSEAPRARFVIVDRDPAGPAARLRSAGLDVAKVFEGDVAVERWLDGSEP